mgnify:FL=1
MTEKQQKAIELHGKGYNCFQSVACVFAPELDVKDKYQSVFTDERKRTWSGEMDLAALEAGQAEEVRALRALFKKDPIKRMSGAAEMVRRWKQEYRMMV